MDTRDKRAASIGLGMFLFAQFPTPDGSISINDATMRCGFYFWATDAVGGTITRDVDLKSIGNQFVNLYANKTITASVAANKTLSANLEIL